MKKITLNEYFFKQLLAGQMTTYRVVPVVQPEEVLELRNFSLVDELLGYFDNRKEESLSRIYGKSTPPLLIPEPMCKIDDEVFIAEPFAVIPNGKGGGQLVYQYDHQHELDNWTLGYNMPSVKSRYRVKIWNWRVEKLKDANDDDVNEAGFNSREEFLKYYATILGAAANPYVFVYYFDLIEKD